MTARYHVAIRRPDDDAILVLRDGSMPGFRLDDPPYWQVVAPVVERMRDDLGLEVEALRAAWLADPAPGSDAPDRLYEAAWRHGDLPRGARWVPLAELERRPSALGRAIDAGVLEPAAGDRHPWYRPGWLDEMTAWVDDRLRSAGLHRRGPVRQVRSWGRSALLTVDTDRGRAWAKQVPAVFAHEVAVTRLLADVDPGIVPPLVAAEVAAGRMLLEHVKGPLLVDPTVPAGAWTATMGRLAEIQRVLADDIDAVRIAGVPGARLTDLAEAVPHLVADADRAMVDAPGGTPRGAHDALVDATTDLVDACHALAGTGVADSLEHGDLSPGQVIVGEMGPVILDWSDATITHPFLAAASFLLDRTSLPADGERDLVAAYLAGWRGGVVEADRALALARVVVPLQLGWLYAERILPGLEQPWEMARMIPFAWRALHGRLGDLPRILRG